MTKRLITREQFIAAFAEGYGVTVARLLAEQDCVACDCDDVACTGWRMQPKPTDWTISPKPIGEFKIVDGVDADAVPPLLDSVRDQFVQQSIKTREALALRMILHGQFPSQGWKIGERTEVRDGAMHYECFPLPPKR